MNNPHISKEFDRDALESALDRILQHLDRLKRPVLSSLQPGLTRADIDTMERNLPFRLPESVRELYAWRNGTSIKGRLIGDICLFPGFYFLSLQDAVTTLFSVRNDQRWSPDWFPLFANGGGDFFVASCLKREVAESPIIGFMLGEDDHAVEYLSVTDMMRTIADCFQAGAYHLNERGHLVSEPKIEIAVARKCNPGLVFWQSSDAG